MKIFLHKILNTKALFQFVFLVLTLFTSSSAFSQFTIPEKPTLQTAVYDYANVLTPTEKTQLEQKLVRYADTTTTQIVIITIESLENENINQLATNWGQKWGIGGTEKDDNGVVILLSKKDRKIAINPGYGLEDRLTAGIGGEIIRTIILPEFKAGSYYQGLNKGTDALFDVFKGKYKGSRKDSQKQDFPLLPFIIIIVIVIILLAKNKGGGSGGGNSGNNRGDIGSTLLSAIILSNLGRSSGGGFGGGSSGGGFGGGGFGGGFGGGGFSGGGSSGGW